MKLRAKISKLYSVIPKFFLSKNYPFDIKKKLVYDIIELWCQIWVIRIKYVKGCIISISYAVPDIFAPAFQALIKKYNRHLNYAHLSALTILSFIPFCVSRRNIEYIFYQI